MSSFGITPAGFNAPRQSDIKAALEAAFRSRFGATVNLSSETIFGQLIGIMSEREALWWEGLEDDVLSATPAGAEGVYVDNLLAYAGLERLGAAPTVTNPTPSARADGRVLYGLVLYGEPGTAIPAGAVVQTSTQPTYSFTLDGPVTIAAAQNAVQRLSMSGVPTQGTYTLRLAAPSGALLDTDPLDYAAQPQVTLLRFARAPSSGTYKLKLGDAATAALPFNAEAAAVQAAIQALDGYAAAGVTGSVANGFALSWPAGPIPKVALDAALDVPLRAIDAVQAAINALVDPADDSLPFADVDVTAPLAGQLLVRFGARSLPAGEPSSGKLAQALVVVSANSLFAGQTAINLAVGNVVTGRPAQGIGTATCTENGARPVPAGALSSIGSSLSGWTGVTNQLDCLPGRTLETDTQAIARREAQLASHGNGPLASIVQQVQQLPGVTTAIGFANLTGAALQRLAFATTPTSGTYVLGYGASATSALRFDATAAQLQAALSALPGLERVVLSGSYTFNFALDPAGSNGGQAVPLVTVLADTTGAGLSSSFARPPKSVELVVEGGEDADIAQALLGSVSAGIATYGAPVLQTTGSCQAGSVQVTLASAAGAEAGLAITMQGLRPNSTVAAVSGNVLTLTLPALSDATNVAVALDHTQYVRDAAGNYSQVAFSRPQQLLIYATVALMTDYFLLPGDASSGRNSQAAFDPASIGDIQARILAAGNAVGVGKTITLLGTTGIASSFRDVPGILDADVRFDAKPNPQNKANLQLAAEQVPLFSTFSTTVSFT